VGCQPGSRVIGAELRTPAARLRTRVLERLKHLGFNLLGYGTNWPTSFNLSRQLQRPMRLKKTPQPSSSDAENAWLKQVPNVVAVGGGVPIKAGTETIGGAGVSSAPGTEKDDACAKAGIAKIADSLK